MGPSSLSNVFNFFCLFLPQSIQAMKHFSFYKGEADSEANTPFLQLMPERKNIECLQEPRMP